MCSSGCCCRFFFHSLSIAFTLYVVSLFIRHFICPFPFTSNRQQPTNNGTAMTQELPFSILNVYARYSLNLRVIVLANVHRIYFTLRGNLRFASLIRFYVSCSSASDFSISNYQFIYFCLKSSPIYDYEYVRMYAQCSSVFLGYKNHKRSVSIANGSDATTHSPHWR